VRGYLGGRRALVICDDEPAHRDFIAGLLEPLGFEVLPAADGQACLELAQHRPIDLFLLDITMPGMSGWELAQRLRDSPAADAPVIMVSANAYESQRESARQSWHDDFIVKPVDFWQLLEKLRHHLSLEWVYEEPEPAPHPPAAAPASVPREALEALWSLGQIGHVRGIHQKLDELEEGDERFRAWVGHLRALVKGFQLNRYLKELEALRSHAP